MGENSGSNLEKLNFVPPEFFKDKDLLIKKIKLSDSQRSFEMIDRHRNTLREFLPWVNLTKDIEDQNKSLIKFEENWRTKSEFNFLIEYKEEYVGGISAHNIDLANLSFEIGYMLFPPFWKKGIMQKAVSLFTKEFFKLGYERAEIRCDAQNVSSALVPLSLGFTLEGIRRNDLRISAKRRDSMVFSALRTDQIEIKKTFNHETSRFILREAKLSDIDNIINYYKRNQTRLDPYGPARPAHFYHYDSWKLNIFRYRHESVQTLGLHLFLFEKNNKEVIGKVSLSQILKHIRMSASLGYHIDTNFEGQGITSEAVKIITAYAFKNFRLQSIEAGFLPNNLKSERVLLKCGFKKCGLFPEYLLLNGKWEDHLVYQLLAR